MRLVPQFFRYVANDRFYRRLLAFVDIEPAGVTRVFKRVKAVKAVEQGVCERVKILLRAWAEELAHMFRGVYDASAAFLILRYNDLRKKTTFPAVPKSSSPWICNVQAGEGETNAGVVPVQKKKEETIAWAEVENTVGLFVEFVSSVGNVEELRGEVCAQIAVRCEVIMDKLERKCVQIDDVQVERRVAVNEMLRKWMGVYKKSLERGRMVREDGGSAAGDGIRMDEDAIT